MTRKSRYFLVGSAAVLLVGLGGGMVAYYAFNRARGVPAGLPAELRYVPSEALMVAFVDVHSVMASEMRRDLEKMAETHHPGMSHPHEFAGINFERDVNHLVAFMLPPAAGNDGAAGAQPRPNPPLVIAQGKFDQARVEQILQEHRGVAQDYHGKRLIVRARDAREGAEPPPAGHLEAVAEEAGVVFLGPDLIAMGPVSQLRRVIDAPASPASGIVTANADLMKLMRESSTSDAWVVGRFDAVTRGVGLPASVRSKVPPVRLVSASADVDGGVKAIIKAETEDAPAADQLRDVVRSALAFVKLSGGGKPEYADAIKSVELGGTGTNVQLSFQITPDTLRALTENVPNFQKR